MLNKTGFYIRRQQHGNPFYNYNKINKNKTKSTKGTIHNNTAPSDNTTSVGITSTSSGFTVNPNEGLEDNDITTGKSNAEDFDVASTSNEDPKAVSSTTEDTSVTINSEATKMLNDDITTVKTIETKGKTGIHDDFLMDGTTIKKSKGREEGRNVTR